MEVAAVDQGDPDGLVAQLAHDLQPSETAADDNDAVTPASGAFVGCRIRPGHHAQRGRPTNRRAVRLPQPPAQRRQASAARLREHLERFDQAGSSRTIGGIHIADAHHLKDRIGHVAPHQPDRTAALIDKSHLN